MISLLCKNISLRIKISWSKIIMELHSWTLLYLRRTCRARILVSFWPRACVLWLWKSVCPSKAIGGNYSVAIELEISLCTRHLPLKSPRRWVQFREQFGPSYSKLSWTDQLCLIEFPLLLWGDTEERQHLLLGTVPTRGTTPNPHLQ